MTQIYSLEDGTELKLTQVVVDRQVRNGVYAGYFVEDGSNNEVFVEVRLADEDETCELRPHMTYGELREAYPAHEFFMQKTRIEVGDVYKPDVDNKEVAN